jgi:Purine nucleoside phosphorylase
MSKKALKQFDEAVKYLKKQYSETPQVGIVLGSGLGQFVEEIEVEVEVSYGDIPHFPVSTVEGYKGRLIFGKLSGKNVVAMAGRFHYYEGYKAKEVIFPYPGDENAGRRDPVIIKCGGCRKPGLQSGGHHDHPGSCQLFHTQSPGWKKYR